MRTQHSKVQLMIRAFCVISLLCLGFAHKTPQLYAASIEAAMLQLPDGTYADLCVGQNDVKHPTVNPFCEACIVCASILLPTPDGGEWLPAHRGSLALPWVFSAAPYAGNHAPFARSRDPPVFS